MTEHDDTPADPLAFVIREGDYQPRDHQAEMCLVGWAIRERQGIAFMQKYCRADDFDHPAMRAIIERAFAKYEADKPISALTLAIACKSSPEVMEWASGDQTAISQALGDIAHAAPYYGADAQMLERVIGDVARTVADMRIRRYAIDGVIDTVVRLREGDDLGSCLAPMIAVADTESARDDQANGSQIAYFAADALFDAIEKDELEGKANCSTGLQGLDEILGGLFQSNLIFVGGRPAMGKSIVGTSLALAGARSKFEVDYFSLEMTKAELIGRMLCDIDFDRAMREGWQPIHYSRVQMRRISAAEKERLYEARQVLADTCPDIEIHDRPELTMSAIASLARAKAARAKKPQLIVIDHMHLIEPSNRYAGRKVDEISEITKGAKRLAKRLDAAVVLLAQLSRDLERREEKAPQLSDFRDSGSIEQDGDVLIGIHRPHYFLERHKGKTDEEEAKRQGELERTANLIEFGILKNRHGKTDTVSAFIDIAAGAIRDEKPTPQRVLPLGESGRLEF